jgi:anti-sigma regulatory factor (Ser/Thr protein kinase)
MTVDFPRELQAPGEARKLVKRFEPLVGSERLADLVLLTSELVTNAVKYGAGGLTLHAAVRNGRLRVEVVDGGTGFPAQETADARDPNDLELVGGWGLPIVKSLASDWGSHEGFAHVWFEFDLD